MKKTIFALSLVALLAAAPAMAQVDLSNYVALGDSMTAGFASASMMDWYQDRSYPAVLAHQAGFDDFEQPYISQPGIGPIFELVSLAPTPVIQPVSSRLARIYSRRWKNSLDVALIAVLLTLLKDLILMKLLIPWSCLECSLKCVNAY